MTAAAPDEDLVEALVRSSFETMGALTHYAAEYDLSLTQLRVIAILRDRTPTLSALAAFLGLEKSTLSGLVDRAAKRGLIERRSTPADRRSVVLALTEDGAALAERVAADIADDLRPALEGLTARERSTLSGLLEKLVAARHPEGVVEPRPQRTGASPARSRPGS